tara:strand:- start:87 stop:1124 length:1038 start_codon:yes stop_codon:yes gene_type:complete
MKKIVDISGYGHSGKTAISQFLNDHDTVFSFPNNIEFELFRVQGGLLDLYLSIYYSWNLIRSRIRINEFKKLVCRIGTISNKFKPWTLWTASGPGYNQYFNNKFIEISNEFIEGLIELKQDTYWPYDTYSDSKVNLFLSKLKNKLNKRLILKEIYYSDRTQFISYTSNYIHRLFKEVGTSKHTHVVLNNSFEPYNPSVSMEMVENSFSIIIDRDPRDIYASMLNLNNVFIPAFEKYGSNSEIKKRMTGFDNINQFIKRYRILKENVTDDSNPNVLRIRYEDFILNHDVIASKVLKHIGLNNPKKIKNTRFNVNDSKKNIGIWKKYKNLDEILQIQKKLGEYCYQN